jgi:hypothetical protein
MTEQAKTPPNEAPSEQDMQEFQGKFDEFFENLSDREKLQTASVVVLATQEVTDEESIEENQTVEPLSEEEIGAFVAKLDGFHDSLPEGQHQILDSMVARTFVHDIPEEELDDVQGNVLYLRWSRWVPYNRYQDQWINYYKNYCNNQGGVLRQGMSTRNASGVWGANVGCYW